MVEARPAPPADGAIRGLTNAEAASRRRRGGANMIRARPGRSTAGQLRRSVTQPLVLLLAALGLIYAALGERREAALVLGVAAAVVAVETWTRWRAHRALMALSRLTAPRAQVWRDWRLLEVPPEELVCDDIVLLRSGSRVPADVRLVEGTELMVDESLVTGESQPVERGAGDDQSSRLLAGTTVVRGWGVGVVTAVGRESTLGQVAGLVREAETPPTPLQSQMEKLARRLLLVALGVSVVVAGAGALRGQPPRDMLLSGLTLAFATIPAELPILVTVVLGLGSRNLARQGAIVRQLSAAETLGATTLVCTDKTGTLTENRIALTDLVTAAEVLESAVSEEPDLVRVKRLAQLASEPTEESWLADPTDLAVWRAADWDWPDPIVRFNFDSTRRLASGLAEVDGRLLLGVKGAPETVLVRCSSWRSRSGMLEHLDAEQRSKVLLAGSAELAAGGARVLAVASRTIAGPPTGGPSRLEQELTFEGLLAFSDPLRPEVPGAMRQLQRAGVRVTMITGDQPATATSIARTAGLSGPVLIAAQTRLWPDHEVAAWASRGCVLARARSEDKLRMVRAAAAAGEVVAVTGDGVNDAPALEAAAIGVAMGRSGADVAREAADLVLADDSFATLVRAMAEGRRLYSNLRKAVRYYLAVKLALIAVSLLVAVGGQPLPFVPVQIVVLQLFIDLGASVAFVSQAAEGDEMSRRPRDPRSRLLDRRMVAGILLGGFTLAALSGGAYVLTLPALGVAAARTLAMVSWLVGHAALGVVMGWERRLVSPRDLRANPALLLWAASAVAFAALLVGVPTLAELLHGGAVPLLTALLVAAVSALLPLWLELPKRLQRQG
jgi:Ca2+-transporting ATPase